MGLEATITKGKACEYCVNAWEMSAVSKYIRGEVVANGRAVPRWWIDWTPEYRAAKKNSKEGREMLGLWETLWERLSATRALVAERVHRDGR